MRQVPQILIIGSGRLARHWQHYHSLLEIPFSQWDRQQDPHLLSKKISQASHVYLCISDIALQPFYSLNLQGHEHCQVVHFSGAFYNPEILGAHPLMTFGPELYDKTHYQKIHFTLDRKNDLVHLSDLLPGFNNTFSFINPNDEAKKNYHAQCVMSGNFPHLLWGNSWAHLKSLGIPFSAYIHYLQTNLDNFTQNPETSLTGPLVRGDRATIKAHLENLNPEEQNIYQAFLKFYESQKGGL